MEASGQRRGERQGPEGVHVPAVQPAHGRHRPFSVSGAAVLPQRSGTSQPRGVDGPEEGGGHREVLTLPFWCFTFNFHFLSLMYLCLPSIYFYLYSLSLSTLLLRHIIRTHIIIIAHCSVTYCSVTYSHHARLITRICYTVH